MTRFSPPLFVLIATGVAGTAAAQPSPTFSYGNISLSVSVAARYDNRPAPLPPFGVPFAAGFTPVAGEIDTITKATLIVSLF